MQTTLRRRVIAITPSRADYYQRCARSAAMTRRFTPTAVTELGQRLHRVVEHWAKANIGHRNLAPDDLLRWTGIQPASDEADLAASSLNLIQRWLDTTAAILIASER